MHNQLQTLDYEHPYIRDFKSVDEDMNIEPQQEDYLEEVYAQEYQEDKDYAEEDDDSDDDEEDKEDEDKDDDGVDDDEDEEDDDDDDDEDEDDEEYAEEDDDDEEDSDPNTPRRVLRNATPPDAPRKNRRSVVDDSTSDSDSESESESDETQPNTPIRVLRNATIPDAPRKMRTPFERERRRLELELDAIEIEIEDFQEEFETHMRELEKRELDARNALDAHIELEFQEMNRANRNNYEGDGEDENSCCML